MMQQTFTIPYPPSLHSLFINVPKRGRIRSKSYEEWSTAAGWELKAQRPTQHIGPVSVDIEIKSPGRRKVDLDNKAKAVLDLLTGPVLADDSLVRDLRLRWADIDGCRITVRALEPA